MAEPTEIDCTFTERLATNYAATPEEAPLVKRVIEDHRAVIRDLCAELRDLDWAIAELVRRREVVEVLECHHRDIAARHAGLLSRARAIPPEVLSLIFTFLPKNLELAMVGDPSSPDRKRNIATSIVRVSQVSRQWRALALSDPLLWAQVPVESIPEYPTKAQPQDSRLLSFSKCMAARTRMVAEFISRSAGLPITFRITARDPALSRDPTLSTGNTFFEAVAPLVDTLRSARWKYVTITLSNTGQNSPFRRLFPVPAHSSGILERLDVQCLTSFTRGNPDLTMPLFPESGHPFKLGHVDIDYPLYLLSTSTAGLDWSSLTELSLGPIAEDDARSHSQFFTEHALRVLEKCKNLVKCDIHTEIRIMRVPRAAPVQPLHFVTLPRLRTISVPDEWVPTGLPTALVLPSLRCLDVVLSHFQVCHLSDELMSPLPLFITNFGSQLTDVTFSYAGLTSMAIRYCLEHLPNVISLTMVSSNHEMAEAPAGPRYFNTEHGGRIDGALLDLLTPKLDGTRSRLVGTYLCPKLEELTCLDMREPGVRVGWMKLISARRSTGRSGAITWLRTANLRFSPPRRPSQVDAEGGSSVGDSMYASWEDLVQWVRGLFMESGVDGIRIGAVGPKHWV